MPDGITADYFTDGRDARRHNYPNHTHWLVEAPHPPLPTPVKTQKEKDLEQFRKWHKAEYVRWVTPGMKEEDAFMAGLELGRKEAK